VTVPKNEVKNEIKGEQKKEGMALPKRGKNAQGPVNMEEPREQPQGVPKNSSEELRDRLKTGKKGT